MLPLVDLIPTYVPWQVAVVVCLFALPAFFGAYFDTLGGTTIAETSPDDGSYSDTKLRGVWLGMILSRYALSASHAAVAVLIAVPLLFIVGAALAARG